MNEFEEILQGEDISNAEALRNQRSEIEKSGSVTSRRDGFTVHCMSVIGQIEGHYVLPNTQKTTKYEHIMPALIAIVI